MSHDGLKLTARMGATNAEGDTTITIFRGRNRVGIAYVGVEESDQILALLNRENAAKISALHSPYVRHSVDGCIEYSCKYCGHDPSKIGGHESDCEWLVAEDSPGATIPDSATQPTPETERDDATQ